MGSEQTTPSGEAPAPAKHVGAGGDYDGTVAAQNDARVVSCLGPAREGRLLIYAGAGVSRPSGLPNGEELARRLHARLVALGLDLGDAKPERLLEVADAAEALVGGLSVLQHEALQVADFTGAPPSRAHVALALLLLEGAVEILTTNWDTCFERGAPAPERIASVVTDTDRREIRPHSLLKVHGCAEQAHSLLITSAQLSAPPVWSDTSIAAGLSRATVIFVGIGDVADYVKARLAEIIHQVGADEHLAVVSPGVVDKWSSSDWATLLPDLPDARKWPYTADEFAERLLSAWVNDGLAACMTAASQAGVGRLPDAFAELLQALGHQSSAALLSWMRRSVVSPAAGKSVASSANLCRALLALALEIDPAALGRVPAMGPWRAGETAVDLLVAGPRTDTGLALAQEALRRAEWYRTRGLLGPAEPISYICSGHIGPLKASASLPPDVMGLPDEGDVVGGGAVQLVDAQLRLHEEAA